MPPPTRLEISKTRLVEIIRRTNAAQFGTFTLSSGATSSFYFDGRLVTLDAEGAFVVARGFFELFSPFTIFNTIGGPSTGAIPIIGAVLADAQWYHLMEPGLNYAPPPYGGFFLRKEKKEHGLGQLLEGHCPEGAKVIVVDDTATTGSSLLTVVNFVKNIKKALVVACFVVVDREEGAKELLAQECGVELHSLFTQKELHVRLGA